MAVQAAAGSAVGQLASTLINGIVASFGEKVGGAIAEQLGKLLKGLGAEVIEQLPITSAQKDALCKALGTERSDSAHSCKQSAAQELLAQVKGKLSPMEYHQLENAIEELQTLIANAFNGKVPDHSNCKQSEGTKPADGTKSAEDTKASEEAKKAEGSSGGDDWFMAIAKALAKVAQDQANRVKEASDKVTGLNDEIENMRKDNGATDTKGTEGNTNAKGTETKGTEGNANAKGTETKGTEGNANAKGTETKDAEAKKADAIATKENALLQAQTELKAQAQKLEFLTTAINTTLDKIAQSLSSLGRTN
ncbi:hypothetical protein HDN1F_02480 [gamma proteobacterium HdN1]|nr:hypothetical protein HDN1F_02480 [gamma proteobacterium HdN1]